MWPLTIPPHHRAMRGGRFGGRQNEDGAPPPGDIQWGGGPGVAVAKLANRCSPSYQETPSRHFISAPGRHVSWGEGAAKYCRPDRPSSDILCLT
jgi:hypothetical protein